MISVIDTLHMLMIPSLFRPNISAGFYNNISNIIYKTKKVHSKVLKYVVSFHRGASHHVEVVIL